MLAAYLKRHNISQAEFARQLGVTPGLVWQWIDGHRPIAAQKCIPIERATGGEITRYQLRPDVFGKPERAAA